jgi:hypothetical protein
MVDFSPPEGAKFASFVWFYGKYYNRDYAISPLLLLLCSISNIIICPRFAPNNKILSLSLKV